MVTADWRYALEMQAENAVVEVEVVATNKHGVLVTGVGSLTGWIPFTRLAPQKIQRIQTGGGRILPENARALKGMRLRAKIIQVNVPERKLVLSEQAASIQEAAARLEVGQVVEGEVTRLVDYGAFVSIIDPESGEMQGANGLIHLSELSWDKVLTPESVVQVNSIIRAKVKRVDAKNGKIELSLKQMEVDPLQETLDSILPVSQRDLITQVPVNIPKGVKDICNELGQEEGVTSVVMGRQVVEKRVVSQDLELWLSKEELKDGFLLVTRAGRTVQELQVTTTLTAAEMREAVSRVLRRLV
jgi:predicted RNA-binding protein with RPS1 domain